MISRDEDEVIEYNGKKELQIWSHERVVIENKSMQREVENDEWAHERLRVRLKRTAEQEVETFYHPFSKTCMSYLDNTLNS